MIKRHESLHHFSSPLFFISRVRRWQLCKYMLIRYGIIGLRFQFHLIISNHGTNVSKGTGTGNSPNDITRARIVMHYPHRFDCHSFRADSFCTFFQIVAHQSHVLHVNAVVTRTTSYFQMSVATSWFNCRYCNHNDSMNDESFQGKNGKVYFSSQWNKVCGFPRQDALNSHLEISLDSSGEKHYLVYRTMIYIFANYKFL